MRLKTLLLFCLFSTVAFAQGSTTTAVPDTNATLKGITIKESSFDPQTSTASLTFVNDYAFNITAWGYCVRITPSKRNNLERSFCIYADALEFVIDDGIENAKRHLAKGVMDCPWCHFIHPGEVYTLSENLSGYPNVTQARIIPNFVVFADGNAEVLHDPALDGITSGYDRQRSVAAGRKVLLKHKEDLLKMAQEVLGNVNVQHPAAAMIEALERATATDMELKGELWGFKRPQWRHADDREFIPEDERGYLRQFIADQQVWIVELSKNQIRGGQQ